MGLVPLDRHRWLEPDELLPIFHRHKIELRERSGSDIYRARASSEPAQQELAALLLQHLIADHCRDYKRMGNGLRYVPTDLALAGAGEEPLWNCSLWVPDDLLILEKQSGDYRLTAASVCSPSNWRLADKFDRSMTDIHQPVPQLNAALGKSIQRFFAHLKVERPIERYNWSLQPNDELNWQSAGDALIPGEQPLYYRCERQSLRRLPISGAIVFSIRVYLHPLQALSGVPGALAALFAAIDSTPAAHARYKGFDRLENALRKYRVA